MRKQENQDTKKKYHFFRTQRHNHSSCEQGDIEIVGLK
jgi:hypothetical protein